MANRDMKLDVLVRLRDQMTGGLGKLTAALARISSTARKIGAVGGIVAGISFMGPMQEAAAFQQQLIDIAGTAELTGNAAFRFVDEAKTKYEQMALEIGQTSETIAAGAGRMIAAGVDVDQVQASIRDIGMAATAANAEFNDMAGVAQSLMLNLQLPAEQVRDSLGALVAAGKLGSFELKDMAREFPLLTSQVAKFGVTGREAVNFLGSGLQIAMKGAAQTSVAANNFSNFLAKALAPRTVRNFKEMGVDIQAVMQDAATKGINPLEAMLQKVQTLTGVSQTQIDKYMAKAKANGLQGAEVLGYVRQQLEKIGAASKMSELFNDQGVLDFLVPMLANIDEYKSIKEQVAKATGAMTQDDFATQMHGINRQMEIFKEIGTQASREVGLAFGGWLPMINGALMALLKRFRDMDAATGGWLKKALSLGAGAVLLAAGIGVLGVALPLVTAGFSALAGVIGLVLSPVGIIIGLLAGAGALIYKNWDKIAPKLAKFWDGVKATGKQAWEGLKSVWAKMSPYMSRLWNGMSKSAVRAFRWIADIGSQAWEKLKAGALSLFSGINWDNAGATMLAAYDATLRGLGATWDWLKQVWEGFKPSLEGIGASFERTFGNLGGTWENIKGIASGLAELGAAILILLGIGDGTGSNIATFLGKLAGGFAQLLAIGIEVLANALHIVSGAIRSIVDLVNGNTPDWRSYFPAWLLGFIDKIGAGISSIKSGLAWISGGHAATQVDTAVTAGKTYGTGSYGALNQMAPANTNTPAAYPAMKPIEFVPPPPQKVDVNSKSEVAIRYVGPITGPQSVTATSKSSVTSDGGLAVGRP